MDLRDDQRQGVEVGGHGPPGLERPHLDLAAEAIAQSADPRYAEDRLATSGFRPGELPQRLGAGVECSLGAAQQWRQTCGIIGRLSRGQGSLRVAGRATPERPGLIGHDPVHLGRVVEAAVDVIGLVGDAGT